MATAKTKEDVRSAKMKALIELLSKRFDDDKILERKGQGGKTFKYVKAQEYIAKLNEVFGVAWGAEVREHFLVNNQVVMRVAITVTDPDSGSIYVRDGWAAHPLSGDVGNAFKSAYSKAFTKAASMVGAGLHLWGVDSDEDDAPTWDMQAHPVGPPVTPVNPGQLPPVPGAHAAPPVPGGVPPVPPTSAGPVPPTFANTGVATPPPPPPPPGGVMAPPPVPTGNPSPGAATAYGGPPIGPDGQPIGPAVASVGVQAAGPGSRIADFQVNGIVAAAVTRGIQDPMELVIQVLGESVRGLKIEQLTVEQAQQVMDAVRSMPPQ